MRWLKLQTLIALVLSGLWGGFLGFEHLRGNMWFLERVEATMTDVRSLVRGQTPAPSLVTIVAIDDATAQQEGSYPLSRASLARIVDAIARLKPKVIAVDMLLVDPGPEAGDQALATALRQTKSVLAAAAVFSTEKQLIPDDQGSPLSAVPDAERLLLPVVPLADAAAVGVVNVSTDDSGTPRFVPMLFRSGDRIESSFPLRVATLATGSDPEIQSGLITLGNREIPTDIGHVLPLTFYGPRGTIHTISAKAALDGNLPAEGITDHIVVLGATVTGGGDVFPTPFDPVLPGVEVIATAITHLMVGDGIVRDRAVRLVDCGFAIVLPMILVGLLAWRRSVIGLTMMALVIIIWVEINVAAFNHGIWLSAALPMAATIPPVLIFGATQLWLGRRQASVFAAQSEQLQRIQAPGLAQWLAANPGFLAEPVQQDAAVIFIDLSGFTGLSERFGPEATRDLLSSFYQLIDDEVAACGGTIINFMGDGAMILFGLPERTEGDAANAVRCSARLCNRARDWLEALPKPMGSRIGFKVGAHFGTVVASRLGGGSRQQITATGDTVNIASRLMEVAASNHMELALSDELLIAAGQGRAALASRKLSGPLDTQLRGRIGTLAIWLWPDGLPQ
ncbi:adenylate/guanylate cyclase domain-containing protein [Rhizobium sp. BK251]|uniref:CHASE2 domain-containing protein n=1 Tax=Rhizobium sp. BK251 TaxID=2512125 RepID=UPI0010534D9C|nr:adenylate/guanylate cyclase domain-containing protein [Rhizobium sp. BK251]TCL73681.1 adenylate cyclase [Rhizobium sp. BK251]